MVIPIKDENPTRRTAYFTIGLLVVNVFVFFFVQPNTFGLTPRQSQQAAVEQQAEEQRFLYEHATVPCEVTTQEPLDEAQLITGECDPASAGIDDRGARQVFADKSIAFSILASMFMHGGLLHLGGNMLFLWIFGNNIEDRMGIAGYAFFYLAAGVAATFAHVFLNPNSIIPVIGASGAIAGVMGAYLVWYPHARILSIIPIFFLLHFVRLPAALVLGLWFVLQFFDAFNPCSGVAVAAHIGGFIVGAAVALIMGRPRPQARAEPGWGY